MLSCLNALKSSVSSGRELSLVLAQKSVATTQTFLRVRMTGPDNVQLSSRADKYKTVMENTLLVCASQKTTIKNNVCLSLNNRDRSEFLPTSCFYVRLS